MSRVRSLKPSIFRSASLSKCCRDARWLFEGLWCEADDYGRGLADPRILKGAIFPLDDDVTPRKIARWMADLERTGHIRLYEIEETAYYLVIKWMEHQSAAFRRGQAQYPAPPCTILHADECKEMQESAIGDRRGGEGRGEEMHADACSTHTSAPPDPVATFDAFWEVYPRHDDKAKARQPYERAAQKVDSAVIVAAAARYAADPNRDPAFTKLAVTWLNAESWNNGPLPARPRGRDPSHNGALIDTVGDELAAQMPALGKGSQ
jgi:hypothetical protein